MMSSTTSEIPGFRTVRTFGVVDAFALRAVGAGGNILGGMQALAGGKLSAYTDFVDSTRKETFDKMCERAGQMGANAVIGVQCDTQGYAEGVREVLWYGTAVLVEPQ
jgi:uncharacterized protein YbjQ (UPF0145 family)